ncbi:protein flightless-1-like [Pomacea canaliculata]|uniref:protein flightless-1-like n=1 Tax=Pomacea canaliculata TaxID=400727 RepID=UPI000D72F000|nr:protein flightless-1-like [Pomacea canaliculata]
MEHFGGELTKCIIETFPEFAEELVNIIYDPVRKDETEVKYILKRSGVHFIHQSWLFPLTSSLTTVILRENKIVQLESCLPWLMPNLIHLDVSHNALVKFLGPSDPSEILCQRLEEVDLSYNLITEEYLDASHNSLERFPPSTEDFWRGSLVTLNLQHNKLDQLRENILKLGTLQKLDVSHNHIEFIIAPEYWDCPSLTDLNLSNNHLGWRKTEKLCWSFRRTA